eukprot:m.210449 g.210449  ORF g.210449 m.210449 type:complete len:64 (-) comp19008_c0_seq2:754-945(-)
MKQTPSSLCTKTFTAVPYSCAPGVQIETNVCAYEHRKRLKWSSVVARCRKHPALNTWQTDLTL